MATTQSSLIRIRKFGGFARTTCTVLMIALAAGLVLAVLAVLGGPTANFSITIGSWKIPGAVIETPLLKAWLAFLCVVGMGLVIFCLGLLRTVFANLAAGRVYTRQNVDCIRGVGLVWIVGGVVQISAALVTGVLLATRAIDWSVVTHVASPWGAGSLTPFVTGSMILLVAWIMDVGRGVSEEAETLRRDAELVV